MPAKPKATSNEFTPSTLEIATLAAGFLPKLDLPEGWQCESPVTLKDHIGKPTGNPFPSSPQYKSPAGWRTPWEVICEEAVKRARTLLDTAAGIVRPDVAEWDAADEDARQQMQRFDERAHQLRLEYDKLAKGRSALPLAEVMKYCLPKAKSESVRMHYFRNYIVEDVRARHQRHGLEGEPEIHVQTDRTVDRREFPKFVIYFLNAYRSRHEAWRKELARTGGEKGGRKAQREKRKAEAKAGAASILSASDTARLKGAAKRALRRKNQLPDAK